tara:strand:+ start:8875 stop:9120 length:246 start_codon:yes stop_codon:yes gene_type:complete
MDKPFPVFDKKGNKIEESYYCGRTLKWRKTFKYDDNNNIIEEVEYNGDGSIKIQFKWSYDHAKNTTIIRVYDGDGNLLSNK